MKKVKLKRLLSLVLAIVLIITSVPTTIQKVDAAAYPGIQIQYEEKWKNYSYGGGTLYATGCGLFSLINCVGYLTGELIDIFSLAQWAHDIKAFNVNGADGTYRYELYPKVQAKYGHLGFTMDCGGNGQGYWQGANSTKLKNHLLGGGVAIGHVYNHFIAIVGYDASSNKFHIYDSAPHSNRGTQNNRGDAWKTEAQMSTGRLDVDWFCLMSPTAAKLPGSPLDLGDSFKASIKNVKSGLNLGVTDSGNVTIQNKTTGTEQQWEFVRKTGNGYEIKNVKTGKCLDVNASSAAEGANVQVWDALNNEAQTWYVYSLNGKYVLRPGCSTKTVLDVAGAGTANGTNVATGKYSAASSQTFEFSYIMPTEVVNLGDDFHAKITNIASGKNLSIYEPNNVVIYESTTNNAQKWHFVRQADGSYEITNVKYNKCLDAEGGAGNSGDNAIIWDDINSTAQRWFILKAGAGYVLRPACSTNCVIDVLNAGTSNDTNVRILSYNGGNAQKFKINPILTDNVENLGETFIAKIKSVGTGKNLAIQETDSNQNVVIGQDGPTSDQQWKFVRQENGSYEITNLMYGKCLDVSAGSAEAGANVQLWDDLDNIAQRWFIHKVNGHYVLRPECAPNCVMDITDGKTEDNTNVRSWSYNASAAQQFDFKVIATDKFADLGTGFTAHISNIKSEKNLTIKGDSDVVIYTAGIDKAQKWEFERQADGTYMIKNAKYGLYLDSAKTANTSYENVHIAKKSDSKTQKWYIYKVASGEYTFLSAATQNEVLDVQSSKTEDNTNVGTWVYSGFRSQRYHITKTPQANEENLGESFEAKIKNQNSNKYVSVGENDNVIQYEASDQYAQDWKFVRQADGSYEIKNVKYNKCLDVFDASADKGANVQIREDIDNAAQRWFIYKVKDGYALSPACAPTRVLDINGGSAENNANVQSWEFISSDAQIFVFEKKVVEEPTTEKQPVEENSAEKQTTEKQTTEKQTTEKQSVEETSTEKTTTEKKTTQKVTVEDTSTEKQTTEKQSVEETSTEKQTTQKPSSEKTTSVKPSGGQETTERATTEKPTEVETNEIVNAQKAEIVKKPESAIYYSKDRAKGLFVEAKSKDGGTLTYQWYINKKKSTSGATEIMGATKATYVPDTEKIGTYYYYCIVTNTNKAVNGKNIAIRNSGYAKVQVKKQLNKISNVSSSYKKSVGDGTFKLLPKANGMIKYKSSNVKVVTVSASGVVAMKGIGSAKITITAGNGDYQTVSKTVNIKVVPDTVKFTSIVSNAKESLSVKWDKMSGISGFKIQYATTKDFKDVKTSYVGSLRHSKTRSDLKSGIKYYVRVCAYKKIGKMTYQGAYSNVKSFVANSK